MSARLSLAWATLVLLLPAPISLGAPQQPSAGSAEPAGDADGASGRSLSFSGYGTLGVVHSSERRADFLVGPFVADGPGHSRSWSPEVDSRVGGQVLASFKTRLSAVVQAVAEQGSDGAYTPRLEWANVKYQMASEASLRAGRIAVPSFMVSDSRKVGFANVWVWPPAEVYALVPLTASDGLDASYRFHTGDFTHTLQANHGRAGKTRPGGGHTRARRLWGATATSERGPTTIRAAYFNARASDAAEVVAIVSVKSAVTTLSRSQAADLFLGRTSRFPNGERAVPLDQPEGSQTRDGFYRTFAERSAAQVKAHWSKILFTGRGRPPAEVADGTAAKRRVSSDPNAIAYIERAQADASVRIVSP